MAEVTYDFSGHAAIITGSGSGTGRAIAEALAAAGAKVAINDLNPDRVDTVVEAIQGAGGEAVGFQGDVTNRFQASALIERARDAFGRVDLLINAAGAFKAEPLAGIDEWDWRRQIEINITGVFFPLQLMSRVMTDEGGGVIINLASTAGHPATIPQGVGYVTGKAGVVAMTKQAARELAHANIRVNAVCIGNLDEPDMPANDPQNAMGRRGTLDELAAVVLFLCSDGARFITGQAINVDGGEHML